MRLVRHPLWVDAIAPTLAIRAVVMVGAVLLTIVFASGVYQGDPFTIWAKWDAPHFFEIVRFGYGPPADPARIVLLPLYPGLIALGAWLVGPLAAGMTISFGATLAAAVGLYLLTRQDQGRRAARGSVIAMCLFPSAFAFVAPYSEAPFLALTVGCLFAARTGAWREAGTLGALAGATRLQGAFLVPALGLEFLAARRRGGAAVGWSGLAWVAAAAIGPAIYLAINTATFGDPFHFVAVQKSTFQVQTIAPWTAFADLWDGVLHSQLNEGWVTVHLAPLLSEILLVITTVWALRRARQRPADAAYTLLTLLSLATLSWPISLPRYLLGVPALFSMIGEALKRPVLGPFLLTGMTMGYTAFLALFVMGHWAF
jgi:hypothetical protein